MIKVLLDLMHLYTCPLGFVNDANAHTCTHTRAHTHTHTHTHTHKQTIGGGHIEFPLKWPLSQKKNDWRLVWGCGGAAGFGGGGGGFGGFEGI